MVRGLATLLLAVSLVAPATYCQTLQPPKSETPSRQVTPLPVDASPAAAIGSNPLPPGAYTIHGKALEVDGGIIADATVWITRFAEPSLRLVETRTDSRGSFSIIVPEVEKDTELVLWGTTPSGLDGCELLKFILTTEFNPVWLRLVKPGESYDEPSLDAVDAWLAERTRLLHAAGSAPDVAERNPGSIRRKNSRQQMPWDRVVETMGALKRSDTPEGRLFAAAALMRANAWQTAGEILAGVTDPRVEHEKLVLEGVRLNLLHRYREAAQVLERTLLEGSNDELASLEIGRAAVMQEDWPGGLQRLDPALKIRHLAAHAHYLRAKCLFALGDIDAAAHESRLLTRRVKKNRVPPQVRLFLDDLNGRLDEGSIEAIRSVMTQPLSEIQKAVPSLARLDTSRIPEKQEMDLILKRLGGNIEKFFRDFASTSALEVIRQARLDKKGKSRTLRRVEGYYVIQQKSVKGKPLLEEIRGTEDGKPQLQGGLSDGFMVSSGFASSLVLFYPDSQSDMDFRYLGRQDIAGRSVHVLGFAQRPPDATAIGIFRSTSRQSAAPVYVQGVVWISADKFQVLRIRTDLLEPLVDAELNRQTSEIDYRPYHFLTNSRTYFLPSRVTVSIDWRRRRLRNEHIFSRFWLFNVDADSTQDRPVKRSAKMPSKPSTP